MRKIVLFIAALLFMAVPVMAVSNVTITCTKATDSNWVTVSYVSDHNLIRAFGLDLTTDVNGITQVVALDANYRIYPGQISIVNGDVNDYKTPYDPCTLGSSHIAVEMGSLYTTDSNYDPAHGGDPNMGYNKIPHLSGNLLKFYVGGNDCNYTVDVNARRGGVVMEDPYETPYVYGLPCTGNTCGPPPPCPVPDVNGMTQTAACAAIVANNLTCGNVTQEVNCTVANGLVLRSNPPGNSLVTCQSSVDIVLSLNPPAPGAASGPTPAAGAKCVSLTQILSWTPGANTATQDVYFGTTNPPSLVASGIPVGTTTYNPGTMAVYTLYYWRIDELNACGVKTTGTVWCFTTGAQAGKACCNNETSNCLGNINGDTRVSSTDLSALTTFISGLPNNRCNTAVGSGTCPPCYDINGDGQVKSTDLSALVTLLSGFANNRHSCPYPSCTNP